MSVRWYLILFISITAAGGISLVLGLTSAYQSLESEREKQDVSVNALKDMMYVKEDLNRLATTGDLIFGATSGVNSYLAEPGSQQVRQIRSRLEEVNTKTKLDAQPYSKIIGHLGTIEETFQVIHRGALKGDELTTFDGAIMGLIQTFREVLTRIKTHAETARSSFDEHRAFLHSLALTLGLAYLVLISLLIFGGDRMISGPIQSLSRLALKALDDSERFSQQEKGPHEVRALGEVLFRLINQLEGEVRVKTADLAEENRVRRVAQEELRKLNLKQRELVEASLRFVPRPFLEFLGKSDLTRVQRGDSTSKSLGILFSDLRGFTSLAEGRSPEEIFELLNSYLDEVVPAIHEQNGFVDKYIGDAVMALFPFDANASVTAAINMFKKLYSFSTQDGIELKMGVGLHWGEVVLGTLGSQGRWESTVIGDAVNLAARLEGMTKAYKCPLIISSSVVDKLTDDHPFQLRSLDMVKVKGRSAPVMIYEVLDAHSSIEEIEGRQRNDREVQQGLRYYTEAKFPNALASFQDALRIYPDDPLPKLYIKRCTELLETSISLSDWDGVFQHTQK
jgi:class 3 adenylate cyclase